MITQFIDTTLYDSIMVKDLKDIEPYLEQFELILPDKIQPFSVFRLVVKASGSDLPCDGNWFHISIADQDLPNATIISQPKGETLSLGMTGEWYVELQSPEEESEDYWLYATMNSVETDESVVKIPFAVKQNPERRLSRTLNTIAFLAVALGVFWLVFPGKMDLRNGLMDIKAEKPLLESSTVQDNSIESSIKAPLQIGNSKKAKNQALKYSKTKKFIDSLLDQSFNNPNVVMRQQAWRKLTDFVQLQTGVDNTYIWDIQQQRLEHKLQMEMWLTSGKNPQETLKRVQVLAFVDDDMNAQRWLGNFYASGSIVVKHLGKAWFWYQRAANKGDTEAQQLLDDLEVHADQLLNSPILRDRLQGYEIAEAAASSGAVNAQLWIGYQYEIGDGVDRDLVVAANLYRKAAEQENTLANEKLSKVLDLIAKQRL